MLGAGGAPPLVTLGVALLWIPGLFCLIAMVVLLIVGSRLWRGGQVARQAAPARCADVRAWEPGPSTCPGPAAPARAAW